jgi:hypothetical protein
MTQRQLDERDYMELCVGEFWFVFRRGTPNARVRTLTRCRVVDDAQAKFDQVKRDMRQNSH